MKTKNALFTLLVLAPCVQSCNFDYSKMEKKAALINNYEAVSLKLARENRELKAEVKRLEYELEKANQGGGHHVASTSSEHESNNSEHGASAHGSVSHEAPTHEVAVSGHENTHTGHESTHEAKREVASVSPHESAKQDSPSKDYVEFKTYKWHAEDMLQIADKEFKSKNFEKAAQFYYSLLTNYPKFKGVNDEYYFKAGIAAYESGNHHEWTLSHFGVLMEKYPTSQYYRSAKLWVGLTHLKLGDKKKFFSTVEEFRKKYRNTNEWKILSKFYENIEEKTNE